METLTALPSSFAAGTTVVYRPDYLADYPAPTWELTLYLNGGDPDAPKKLSSVAADSGSDHVVTLAATATDDLTPGLYRWVERVSDGSEVFDVAWGVVTVKPDVATANQGELRSWAERALAAVECKILARIPLDQEQLEIFTRAVQRYGLTDFVQLRDRLRAEVAAEQRDGAPRAPILQGFTPMGWTQ